MLIEALWPYPAWRAGQYEIARRVYASSMEGRHLLVSYPTGAGKTAAVLTGALAASLEGGFKILYIVRTKSQFQAPRRELRLLAERVKLSAVFLQNKRDLCLIRGAKLLPYDEFLNFCSELTRSGLCPYYQNARLVEPPEGLLDHSALISLASEHRACPYEVARKSLRGARVIVAAYNYVFDPQIRKVFLDDLGVGLGDALLVVDEAHNLPHSVAGILSKEISERALRAARREVARTIKRPDLERDLYALAALLRKLRGLVAEGSEREVSVDDLRESLPNVAELSKLVPLVERSLGRASLLRRLVAFLQVLELGRPEYAVAVRVEGGEVKLTAHCISPSKATAPLFAEVRSAVLASGTMPPKRYLASLLGLEERRVDEVRLPSPWAANIGVVVVKGVTSRYVERGEATYEAMSRFINGLYERLPSGVCLIIAPSYDMAKALRPYLRVKPLVVEREDTRLDEVEEAAQRYSKLAVLGVAWGKLVEGIELKRGGRSLVRLIIVAGLPVPEPNVLNRRLVEVLRHRLGSSEEAWRLVYMVPAAVKVAQAIGRSVRSEGDKSAVAILDERALEPEVRQQLDELGYAVRAAESLEEVLGALEGFML